MKMIKHPAGKFSIDTLMAAPYWNALRPGDGYSYEISEGTAKISAPEFTAISAPEDSLIAYLGDGRVLLTPKTKNGEEHYKRRRWYFYNVKVLESILDKIKNSTETIKMSRELGQDVRLRAAEIQKGQVFAGAGFYRWALPYTFKVSLQYRDKDGISRFHDPVNAINYWLEHQVDIPQDRNWA